MEPPCGRVSSAPPSRACVHMRTRSRSSAGGGGAEKNSENSTRVRGTLPWIWGPGRHVPRIRG